jgi:drug/metabolite transporter (DMT)-like permease
MVEFFKSRRKLGIVIGFLLISVGLILAIPGVPGPGIPIVLLGLVILSGHFSWAKRLLDWAKQKSNWSRDAKLPLDSETRVRPRPILPKTDP